MASYLSWPKVPLSQQPQMSFVVALALFDCLTKYSGDLSLKWPNDVLWGGRKISGILLETAQVGDSFGLVAGIGVNLMHAPETQDLENGAVDPISLRAATGQIVPAEIFLDELAPSVSLWEARWLADGFAPIREGWLSRATGLGTRIKARLPNKTHEGVFEDIDETGALVLATHDGRLVLPAAEVHF